MILIICFFFSAGTVVFCSFFEWFVHGPLMHGTWGNMFLNQTHRLHHENFATPKYKNDEYGPHVHLPLWSGILMIGFMAMIGGIITYFTGHWEAFICLTATSAGYYWLYQYVHTCLHVPKKDKDGNVKPRWFQKIGPIARWFDSLDRYHHIHHAHDKDFSNPVNLCILVRFADLVMGTRFKPRRVIKEEGVCS
jgi:hypothetical protein